MSSEDPQKLPSAHRHLRPAQRRQSSLLNSLTRQNVSRLLSSDDLPTLRRPKMPICRRKLLGVPLNVVLWDLCGVPQPHDAFRGNEPVEFRAADQAAFEHDLADAFSVLARGVGDFGRGLVPDPLRERGEDGGRAFDIAAAARLAPFNPASRAAGRSSRSSAAGPGRRATRRRPAAGTGSAPGCRASTPARSPGRWPSPPSPPARPPRG